MSEWSQLQRDLYSKIRSEIDFSIKSRPSELIRYEKVFLRDASAWRDSSHWELVRTLNKSQIAFIGDFHTLRQSQRLILRLLRDKEVRKPDSIGFEVVGDQHLEILHRWLRHPSEKVETTLKRSLQLETKWGSSWETYRDIFKFCSERKIGIVPLLHREKSLHKRDSLACDQIVKTPGRIWVLFGEFHCARPHLPRLVLRAAPERKLIVIQQNEDRATLARLERLSTAKTLILAARESRSDRIPLFCILHTPLWVKWQSYLERNLKISEDTHEMDENLDPQEQINWSLETLLHFFQDTRYPFPQGLSEILDYNVYGPDDSEFARSLLQLPAAVRRSAYRDLKISRVASLASYQRIYLAEVTVNSCAQAAGAYLFQIGSQVQMGDHDFYKKIFLESMAFFMSKLLNHSRRAMHWKDWETLSERAGVRRKEARAVLRAKRLFDYLSSKPISLEDIRPYQREVAVAVGKMLGDSLFEAFLVEEFSRSRFLRLLTSPLETEAQAIERIVEIQSVGRAFEPLGPRVW